MKDYSNCEARMGEPSAQGKHDAAMRGVDGKTSHLTQPKGGAKQIGGQKLPTEKTTWPKDNMAKVKKIAGGSNY